MSTIEKTKTEQPFYGPGYKIAGTTYRPEKELPKFETGLEINLKRKLTQVGIAADIKRAEGEGWRSTLILGDDAVVLVDHARDEFDRGRGYSVIKCAQQGYKIWTEDAGVATSTAIELLVEVRLGRPSEKK